MAQLSKNRCIKSKIILVFHWLSYYDNDLNNHVHFEQYSDLKEILNHAITRLPEDQKAVILLRDYEGYSYKEIAGITSLTESQVKVYIYRARVFLKNYIVKMENVA